LIAGGDWLAARRLLAVRLDAMGDVVMTGPALRALKSQRPDRHLTLLTSPAGAEAAGLLPEVDEVIGYRAPWMKHPAAGGAASDLRLAERLRARRFDAGVIFTVYSQSPLPAALLLHLAGVPLRLAHCRENPYHLLSHWVRESEPEAGIRHEVRRQLDLVAAVGARAADERLRVEPREGAARSVDSLLRRLGLDRRRDWLVAHPGASASSRRYPPELYAQALRTLSRANGLTPVLTGSESERPLTARVRALAGLDFPDLSGLLDLHELAALLARAPLLVANNTGPVHLAAGSGTPVVDVYALTNPQHTPWRVPSRVLSHDVPCRFCYRSICPEGHHACLNGVAPAEVATAAAELWAERWGAGSRRVDGPPREAMAGYR
jgi:lipopolysaccharide heptosyltransferase II